MISELNGLANNSGYRIKNAEVFREILFHNTWSGSATNKSAPSKLVCTFKKKFNFDDLNIEWKYCIK